MFSRRTKNTKLYLGKEKKALPVVLSLLFKVYVGEGAFSHPSLKAGLTVEAACVLPLFLWAVTGAFYLIEVSAVQIRLMGGIRDAARKMAVLSYGVYGGNSDEEREIGVGEVVGGTLSAAYARNLVLDGADLEETALKNETKISLAPSDFSDKNIVDLKVISRITIPVPIFRIRILQYLERGRVRAWTGRSPTEPDSGSGEEKGEMVYVAATGTVYHRSADCTHIRLSIASSTVGNMDRKRNTGGGKYYACSCYQAHPSGTVYYTKSGSRYHSSLSCSSLKRTVRKVELSSVKGLKPCSKCG